MSISSETRRAGPFTGNGATVAFPFTFKVFTTAQVVVTRTVSGVETVLTLTTDYTVALNSNQDTSPGGTVTMLTAPATGQSITITSNVLNLQPTVLANLGGFYPEVINDSLDRATIQIQQLDERLDRALVIPVSSVAGINTTLPAPQSSSLLGWNPSGTGLQNYNSTLIGSTTYQYIHRAIATAGQAVFVLPAPYVLNANAIEIYVNGLRLEQGSGLDWVETNTTTVTFNSGLALNDLVTFVVNILAEVVTVAPSYEYVHRVTATAGQTVFTLPNPYNLNANAVEIYVNGLRVEQGGGLDWTETTTTSITFNAGLTVGDQVTFIVNVEAETLPIAAFPASAVSAFGAALVDDANAAAGRVTLGISAFGSSLIDDADAAAGRATLGISAFGSSLIDDADAAAGRTTLGLGTLATLNTVNNGNWSGTALAIANGGTGATTAGAALTALGGQPLDATLTALAGLATGADKLAYSTGTDTFSQADFTSFARTLLDDADAAAGRTTLGLGTTDNPQFATIELGNASDTTLSRSAAGVLAVEGVDVVTLTATQTLTNKTLSGATITDATDIVLATGTGTKIGTATSQKLGFYNAAPVAQYSTVGTTTGFTAGSGSAVLADSTFTGDTGATAYTIGDVVRALKTLGLLAS